MKRIVTLCIICLWVNAMFAQNNVSNRTSSGYSPVGAYSKIDWQKWIDTTWGQGISTAEKLTFFDLFWSLVDREWGGFPNLVINWDSLRSAYRPQIEAGVSRGRFYGILSRLTRALNEWHVYAVDMGIDSTFKHYGLYEYPISSFFYKPGIPLFYSNELWFRSSFGAGVTVLPDSTALVYSVMPNHPLGLQPGDIILGYNGIPWKYLLQELLAAELPITKGGAAFGSTSLAHHHVGIMSAGLNWGLFDTIDVFKYSTGQTVHYPISPLRSLAPPYHIATEQLPVSGVPFPNLAANKFISWGIVDGTTVGYIYAWDWYGVPFGETQTLFGQAVYDLVQTRKVTGLILDFRTNWGGAAYAPNTGFSYIFHTDPTLMYQIGDRVAGGARNSFTFRPSPSIQRFTPGSNIYDRPIAVLTGPMCGSSGDYAAFKLRFHPMVRFFGKPTNGAFAYRLSTEYNYAGSYWYALARSAVYSNVPNEGFLIHKGNPVDEAIWLTQEGVAKGEDDVVKRALEWVTTTAHAHSPKTNKNNYALRDTIVLTATVFNPINHALALQGFLTQQDTIIIDSAQFFNDGMHGDGTAGDSIWGCFLRAPGYNAALRFRIRCTDLVTGTERDVPYKIDLTTPVLQAASTIPDCYSLDQNYPNPFNPETKIEFSLPKSSIVNLTIFDLLGREVAVLVNEEKQAGIYSVTWKATNVSSGLYFYKLQAGEFQTTKKMILMR